MSYSHGTGSSSNGARSAARALEKSETDSHLLPTFKSQVTGRADFEDHIPTVEAQLLADASLLEGGMMGQEVPRTVTNTTGTQPARAEKPHFQTAATNGEGGNYNNGNDVVPSTQLSDDNGKEQPASSSREPYASKKLILVALLIVVVIVVVGIIVSLASTSPSASIAPSPTAPSSAQFPSEEGQMCGNGKRGNGDCADDACCSEWGWCGISAEHCRVAPSPPPAVSPMPSASASPTASIAPSTTAPSSAQFPSVEGLMCGNGNRGNGDCADDACCSESGWCGISAEFCGVA